MKIDYLSQHKYKPRKPWWEETLSQEERSKYYQLIQENPSMLGKAFADLQLNQKELHKHTILETLQFDSNEPNAAKGNKLLLAFFNPNGTGSQLFVTDL